MSMQAKKARHLMAQGKLAATSEGKRHLHSKGALSSGGSVKLAKAILMAEGGTVPTRPSMSPDESKYLPPELDIDPKTGKPYIDSEDFVFPEEWLEESERRLHESARQVADYAEQAKADIGKGIDAELLEFVERSPSRYFQIASDPVAYQHWRDLRTAAETDDDLAELDRKLSSGGEFWKEVEGAHKAGKKGMRPGESGPSDAIRNMPASGAKEEEQVRTQPTGAATPPLRQFTDDRGVVHLTNRPAPMMAKPNSPPAPDVDAMMYGRSSATPSQPSVVKKAKGGRVEGGKMRQEFAKAILRR